jgi:hypothetical protein
MGITIIENYEPEDKGWGIVVGRLRPKPEPKPDVEEPSAESSPSSPRAHRSPQYRIGFGRGFAGPRLSSESEGDRAPPGGSAQVPS